MPVLFPAAKIGGLVQHSPFNFSYASLKAQTGILSSAYALLRSGCSGTGEGECTGVGPGGGGIFGGPSALILCVLNLGGAAIHEG